MDPLPGLSAAGDDTRSSPLPEGEVERSEGEGLRPLRMRLSPSTAMLTHVDLSPPGRGKGRNPSRCAHSLPLVGRVRVGVPPLQSEKLALTPPPPAPPHRKSGVPDLRLGESIPGRP